MATLPCTIRRATLADIPAIVSLILTSFRTFPLFSHLYSPLQKDVSAARDTAFFWRRRARAAILDPQTSVIVAEAAAQDVENDAAVARSRGGGDDLSWEFLKWGSEVEGLSQETQDARVVVGFAIWRWKGLSNEQVGEDVEGGWTESFKGYYYAAELWAYSKLYTRKDLNVDDYAAYSRSEVEYQDKHYSTDFQCLYLDNLCVDFRCQRRSVGRALIECGVHNASKKKIPIMTEASEEGSEFYKRLGFEQVDQWVIPTSGGATVTTLAVLQLKTS